MVLILLEHYGWFFTTRMLLHFRRRLNRDVTGTKSINQNLLSFQCLKDRVGNVVIDIPDQYDSSSTLQVVITATISKIETTSLISTTSVLQVETFSLLAV